MVISLLSLLGYVTDNVIEKLKKNLPNLLHEQSPLCPQFLSYEQQLVLLPPAEA